MSLNFYLQKIHTGKALAESEAAAACEILMQQEMGTPSSGAFLMALAMRGETTEELVGMALNIHKRTTILPVSVPCSDILSCGTTNTSPAVILGAALTLATAGITIAKLLTSDIRGIASGLGLQTAPGPEPAATNLAERGFALIDAADYTEMLRSIRAHQQSLPIPTVFERLIPLTHPVALKSMVVGVNPATAAMPLAQALRRLRTQRAVVLTTEDGTCPFASFGAQAGKITLIDQSRATITQNEIQPADYGFDFSNSKVVASADSEKQVSWLRAMIDGRDTPLNQPIIWAAALGIYAASADIQLPDAIKKARDTVTEGQLAGVFALISRKAA
ncbi:MAG: hypothetical protein AB7G06_09380 [Bdellovibrionales bacterium]